MKTAEHPPLPAADTRESRPDADGFIRIRNAAVNNLQHIDLDIPRNRFVVLTGLSGSGKSSLAFETLFAEGQRRFAESLSSFARQFLGRMAKPDVESISGIPPAIAVEQKVNTRNPRSTVGTSTEIYDYLRLLFARIGRTYSPVSGKEVTRDSVETVLEYAGTLAPGTVALLTAHLDWLPESYPIEQVLNLREDGFTRLLFSGSGIVRMDAYLADTARYDGERADLLVDRIVIPEEGMDEDTVARLCDSVQTAFDRGEGRISLIHDGTARSFSTRYEADGIRFEPLQEWDFNYNNPLGACKCCNGLGLVSGIDENLVIPDPTRSLYEDGVACWRGDVMKHFKEQVILHAAAHGFPVHTPYRELTPEQKRLLWEGCEDFDGIRGFFRWAETKKHKIQFKYLISRYSGRTVCPECGGTRLRPEARYVRIGGKNIAELTGMTVGELSRFFHELKLTPYEERIAAGALREIRLRLQCIEDVGLSYLTLSRASNTLSGGESQRINLVSSLGNSLTGSMYILDEPSIGLHPRDTRRLISVLKRLRDLGNTVIVVEHDAEIIRAADWLIDIGPAAGTAGGKIVYSGPVPDAGACRQAAAQWSDSRTLAYLAGVRTLVSGRVPRTSRYAITVRGASENNLQGIDVRFPLRVMTVVTGVSGSGKSSLVGDILYPALRRELLQLGDKPGLFHGLDGDLDKLSGVEYVDQNPIGKSSRSNPATYLKIYDDIRKLYSEQPYAKANGFGHSHFSFNIDGGRCPECLGEGTVKIPMQFMADIVMPCEACGGRRFLPEILEVKYKGKNISEILDLTVAEAYDFFSAQPEAQARRIAERLQPLRAVGLDYIRLGQSSSTLSGGESQRVKLAYFLSKDTPSTLFIFDEPTTGLHFADIDNLMRSFQALLDRGHTLVIVEHNTDVIRAADWVIDLGPDGGAAGGRVVYEGTPEGLARHPELPTGAALQ